MTGGIDIYATDTTEGDANSTGGNSDPTAEDADSIDEDADPTSLAGLDDPVALDTLTELGDRWPGGGTYVLVLELPRAAEIEVGALGVSDFPAGGYAYVGSALGTGGFSRVARHAEIAAGEREVRHWHVDSLTGHPDSRLRAAVLAPGFGASDCDCHSHLAHRSSWTDLLELARKSSA